MEPKTIKLSEKNKDFFEMVYQLVRLIPEGRVSSYGEIAKYLGSARGARMVGWAMNASHGQKEYVPAHRVVNRLGLLSGKHHFPKDQAMEDLLRQEGVVVEEDKVQNFENIFWNPNIEMEL